MRAQCRQRLKVDKFPWHDIPLFYKLKNLPASRAHSHRAQLASLASLSAPRARDSIVALRAP